MEAEKLKELQGKMTSRALAVAIGVTEQTIRNWREKGCHARHDISILRAIKALTKV